MALKHDTRGRIYETVWDSKNIWAGNGNLKPEFAGELVRLAGDKDGPGNRFIPHAAAGQPTHRFRMIHEEGSVVIYQQTPVGQNEHTVAKYNAKGQRITDAKELWDFPAGKVTKGEELLHQT
jgi:hypothetical protein